MFIQTQPTPNPNALKFVPGRTVSNCGSHEITKKDNIDNDLVRNILSINGVMGVFLGKDFISVNKDLTDAPETVNSVPYDGGWFYKIRLTNDLELDELMDAEAYADHVEEE